MGPLQMMMKMRTHQYTDVLMLFIKLLLRKTINKYGNNSRAQVDPEERLKGVHQTVCIRLRSYKNGHY